MRNSKRPANPALDTERTRRAIRRSGGAGEALPDGWRRCEFCGCRTNAKVRGCCQRGRDADGVNGLDEAQRNVHTALRRLIADDAYAMTFQTMGQYRTALLRAIDAAAAAAGVNPSSQDQQEQPND